MYSFGSDNHSGVHPKVMKAIVSVNEGSAPAYGSDSTSLAVQDLFKREFGVDAKAYLLMTGTAANVLAIKASCRSYQSVLANDQSHIYCDEAGAVEHFSGSRIQVIPHALGKLNVQSLKSHLQDQGNEHRVQAKLISITQSTELGTCYRLDEIKAIADFAHEHHMYLHMDGARISQAASFLNCSFKDMTTNCGVDLVSFGGTKNGLMMGEALIVLNSQLDEGMPWLRKQGMQLCSKMRYIAAQFEAFFDGDLWNLNAKNSNEMAQYMAFELEKTLGINPEYPVEANELFISVPTQVIEKLSSKWGFYVWAEDKNLIRLVTSWDTTRHHIDAFITDVSACL